MEQTRNTLCCKHAAKYSNQCEPEEQQNSTSQWKHKWKRFPLSLGVKSLSTCERTWGWRLRSSCRLELWTWQCIMPMRILTSTAPTIVCVSLRAHACVSMHVLSSFHQLCSVLPDIENLHLKLCMCINEYLQAHRACVRVCACACACMLTCALYLRLLVRCSVCVIHTLVRQGTLISSLSSLDPF